MPKLLIAMVSPTRRMPVPRHGLEAKGLPGWMAACAAMTDQAADLRASTFTFFLA